MINENELDKLANKYKRIGDLIKKLNKAKDDVKVQLMALDGESSDHWSISVKEYNQERIESLKAIKDKSQTLFNALHEAGCVKEITATRLNVKEIK